MPFAMQAKLLRVLQEREFVRLGAKYATKTDLTHPNRHDEPQLREEIQEKRFREDLFFRLNVIPLYLAPLRQRREDIPLLANTSSRLSARRNGKPLMTISEAALASLTKLDWPGNVRQLQNINRARGHHERGRIWTSRCSTWPRRWIRAGAVPARSCRAI